MSDVRYEWDISDAENHLDALLNGPGIDAVFLFEAVFLEQYAQVKADVHIRTGSLLESGIAGTDKSQERFEGTMSFGGQSGGIIGTVDYAHIEMDRTGVRRVFQARDGEDAGTSHDFFRSARGFDPGYVEVIEAHYGQSGLPG